MKIINNYEELILSIETNDVNRLENLLGYSDCRNRLINRYIKDNGTDNISKIISNLQATALRNEIEDICDVCDINNNYTKQIVYSA